MKTGPESDLVRDYLDRFSKTGRGLGLGPAALTEVEDRKKGGQIAEAQLLRRAVPSSTALWMLDERGRTMTSPEFASLLAQSRDQGQQDIAILIGGADGLAPDLRRDAALSISFGKMVWPHMLARVMLAEQLYRAATILAGTPYHRA